MIKIENVTTHRYISLFQTNFHVYNLKNIIWDVTAYFAVVRLIIKVKYRGRVKNRNNILTYFVYIYIYQHFRNKNE